MRKRGRVMPQIQRIWQADMRVYGADKVWRQLVREGTTVARCTVERPTHSIGLRGRDARQSRAHHRRRCQGPMPAGPSQSAVPCRAAKPAVGQRLNVSLDLAGGLTVRRLRHRHAPVVSGARRRCRWTPPSRSSTQLTPIWRAPSAMSSTKLPLNVSYSTPSADSVIWKEPSMHEA